MSRLLMLRDVARTLGLSVRKVRMDAAAGRFAPALVRFGRAVRVRESELSAWIDAGCPDRNEWQKRENHHAR
ncbi:MAG: helix-turn-helix domain-containing protein [Phycisphaerae bacterium]|nr:helix-turn-helix domain-containing protein [Phycisphaerae bacterium]